MICLDGLNESERQNEKEVGEKRQWESEEGRCVSLLVKLLTLPQPGRKTEIQSRTHSRGQK